MLVIVAAGTVDRVGTSPVPSGHAGRSLEGNGVLRSRRGGRDARDGEDRDDLTLACWLRATAGGNVARLVCLSRRERHARLIVPIHSLSTMPELFGPFDHRSSAPASGGDERGCPS